jgi:hypothetical protein
VTLLPPPPKLPSAVTNLVEDLLLPEPDTANTVQVGHSPLPLDESDCDLPVRIGAPDVLPPTAEMCILQRVAPTVLLRAARDPADEPHPPPRDYSTLVFALLLLAISLASLTAGVLMGPMLD